MAEFVSGSEILSNQGNAALGYGAGAEYAGNPAVINPLQGIDDTMRALHAEDFNANMANYHQKIKDRDEVYKMLAEGADLSGNIPGQSIKGPDGRPLSYSLLDPDKAEIQRQADEVKNIVVNNPNIKNNRAQFSALQQKLGSLQEAKQIAQARAVQASQQRLEIVNENDEEERAARQKHLAEQLAIPGKVPDPYMKPLSYDLAQITPDVEAKSKGMPEYITDANGLVHKIDNVVTPLESFDNISKYIPGNPYFTQANNMYKRAVSSQQFLNPDFIAKANEALAAVNAKEGLKPGDPKYIQPLAVVGENGQVVPNQNVPEFVRSLHIAQKYKNAQTDVLDKDAQGAYKTLAAQRELEAKTKLTDAKRTMEVPAHTQQMNSLSEKYKAEADLARRKGDKLQQEAAREKGDALAPVKQAFDAYDEYANKLPFQPASDALAIMNPKEAERLTSIIGKTDGMQVAVVPSNDQSALEILSRPKIDQGTEAKGVMNGSKPTGKVLGTIPPKYMYMTKSADGNPDEAKLIGVFNDGSTISVDRKDAIDRLIDYKGKYAGGEKIIKLKNASRMVMDELVNTARPNKGAANPVVNVNKLATNDLRDNGGVIEVNVNGVWKKVKGKNKAGDLIFE